MLHPDVSLRREPFGALAYHYGNRRLVFLRSPELVELVEQLAEHPSLHETFEALGTPAARRPALGRALHQLRDSEVIRAR
jgi:putative mycofactocin binding protein MftB